MAESPRSKVAKATIVNEYNDSQSCTSVEE